MSYAEMTSVDSGALIVDNNRGRICELGRKLATAGQVGASWLCRKIPLIHNDTHSS